MRNTTIVWKTISYTVINKCITTGSCGVEKSVNKQEEHQDESDWRELQG